MRLSVESCRIEQKGPRTNTEQCRLPPSIQNASTVILPPAHGLCIRHFISFTAAFFSRRARLQQEHFFARQSMYVGCARLRDNSRARLPLPCTYRLHVCSIRAVRPAYSRTAKDGNYRAALYGDFCPSPRNSLIAASSRNGKNSTLTQQAQTGGIERQRSAIESAICLTRFSVPLRRRTTARKTCLSMV